MSSIVEVLVFRGTGGVANKDHPYYGESALVRAGHVGLIGVIEGKIIGFHPTPEAANTFPGEEALITALMNHEPQPGRLQDDTEYFYRAHELAQETNGRTTVYTYSVVISDEMLDTIRQWYDTRRESPYNFPDDDGHCKPGESNCALFWENFEIPLPLSNGQLRLLSDYMREEQFEVWHPNDF